MDVSVIIPCYNAAPYIAQAIGSVLEQHHPPAEIIVVDDGSTDRSASIARRFGDPVTVVSKRCGGASRARNYGCRLATSKALMFLDADDVLGPEALAALADALATRPDGIAVCPWYRLEHVDGTWVRRPASCTPRRTDQDPLSGWLTGWWHPPCSVLWSRAAFERTQGWDQRAYVNDDGDLMMRALADDTPLVTTSEGAAYYRRLPDDRTSVSDARFTKAGLAARIYVAEKIATWLEEKNKIDRYREPLRTKFEEIGRDCKAADPSLHARCKRLASRYGAPRWMQAARSLIDRVITASRRLGGKLKRIPQSLTTASDSAPRPESAPSVEIRFGLATASQAQAASSGQTTGATTRPQNDVPSRRPAVSVVIPTYNRAALVGRAIESVLAQTFEDFELLVVDDGSTDDTARVVKDYQDPRIRYLVQPENRGVSAARNRGLRTARGKYIAFLDSDDAWFQDKLENQIARFRSLPDEVGLIYCGVETIDDSGERWVFQPEHRGDVYPHMLVENAIHAGSGVVIRRNVIRTVGFFDEDIPAIEDWDYWLRTARFYTFDAVEEPLFRYHDHGSAERKSLNTKDNLAARAWFFEKHAAAMRRAEVDHLFLIESARRHLVHWDDVEGARRLMGKAVLRRPFARAVYHPPFSRLKLLAPPAIAPHARRVIMRGRHFARQLLGSLKLWIKAVRWVGSDALCDRPAGPYDTSSWR